MEGPSTTNGMTDMEWLEREQEKEMIELAMERSLSEFQAFQNSQPGFPRGGGGGGPLRQPMHNSMPAMHHSYNDHYGGSRRDLSVSSHEMNHRHQYPQHRFHERDRISNRRATYNSSRPDAYSGRYGGPGHRENSLRSLGTTGNSPVMQRPLAPMGYPRREGSFREVQEVTETVIESPHGSYGSSNPSSLYHDRRHSSGPLHQQYDYRASANAAYNMGHNVGRQSPGFGERRVVSAPAQYHHDRGVAPSSTARQNMRIPRHEARAAVLETARQHLSEEDALRVEEALNLALRSQRHGSNGRESRQQMHRETDHSGGSSSFGSSHHSRRSGNSRSRMSPEEQRHLEEALYASRANRPPSPPAALHERQSSMYTQETMDLLRRASASDYFSQEELDQIEQALEDNDTAAHERGHHENRQYSPPRHDHHVQPHHHQSHHHPRAPPSVPIQQHHHSHHFDERRSYPHERDRPQDQYPHERPRSQEHEDIPYDRERRHNNQLDRHSQRDRHMQERRERLEQREGRAVRQPRGYRPNPRFAATTMSTPRRTYSGDSLALAKEEIQKAVAANTLSKEEYDELMMALGANSDHGNGNTEPETDTSNRDSNVEENPLAEESDPREWGPVGGSDGRIDTQASKRYSQGLPQRSASFDSISERHNRQGNRRGLFERPPMLPPNSHEGENVTPVLAVDDFAISDMCPPFPESDETRKYNSDREGEPRELEQIAEIPPEAEGEQERHDMRIEEEPPKEDETHGREDMDKERSLEANSEKEEDPEKEEGEAGHQTTAEVENSTENEARVPESQHDVVTELNESHTTPEFDEAESMSSRSSSLIMNRKGFDCGVSESSTTRGNRRASDGGALPPSNRGQQLRLGSSHHSQSRHSRRSNTQQLSAALAALPYARASVPGAPGSVSVDMEYSVSQFGDSVATFGSDIPGPQRGEGSAGSVVSSDTDPSRLVQASPPSVASQTVRGLALLPPPLGGFDEDDGEEDVLQEASSSALGGSIGSGAKHSLDMASADPNTTATKEAVVGQDQEPAEAVSNEVEGSASASHESEVDQVGVDASERDSARGERLEPTFHSEEDGEKHEQALSTGREGQDVRPSNDSDNVALPRELAPETDPPHILEEIEAEAEQATELVESPLPHQLPRKYSDEVEGLSDSAEDAVNADQQDAVDANGRQNEEGYDVDGHRRHDEEGFAEVAHRRQDEENYAVDANGRQNEKGYDVDGHRRHDEEGYAEDAHRRQDEETYAVDAHRRQDEEDYAVDANRRHDEEVYDVDANSQHDEEGYALDAHRRRDEEASALDAHQRQDAVERHQHAVGDYQDDAMNDQHGDMGGAHKQNTMDGQQQETDAEGAYHQDFYQQDPADAHQHNPTHSQHQDDEGAHQRHPTEWAEPRDARARPREYEPQEQQSARDLEQSRPSRDDRDDLRRYEVQHNQDGQPIMDREAFNREAEDEYYQQHRHHWGRQHMRDMRGGSERFDRQRWGDERVREQPKRSNEKIAQEPDRTYFRQRQHRSSRRLGRSESDPYERERRNGSPSRQRRSDSEAPDVPQQVQVGDPRDLREAWAATGRSNSVSSLGESTQYSIYSAHFRNAEDYDRYRNEDFERARYEHQIWRQSHPTPVPHSMREPSNPYAASDHTGSSRRLQHATNPGHGFQREAEYDRERPRTGEPIAEQYDRERPRAGEPISEQYDRERQQTGEPISEHDRFDEDLKRALYESMQMQRQSQTDDFDDDLQGQVYPEEHVLSREKMEHINRALSGADTGMQSTFDRYEAPQDQFPGDNYANVERAGPMAREISDPTHNRLEPRQNRQNEAPAPSDARAMDLQAARIADDVLDRALQEAKDEEERQSLLLARQLQEEDERRASRARQSQPTNPPDPRSTEQSPSVVRPGAVGSTSPIRRRHPLETEPSMRLSSLHLEGTRRHSSPTPGQRAAGQGTSFRSSHQENSRRSFGELSGSVHQSRSSVVGAVHSSSPERVRHPLEDSYSSQQQSSRHVGAIRSSTPERVHPLEESYSSFGQGRTNQVGAVRSSSPDRARHPLEDSYSSQPRSTQVGAVQSNSPARVRHPMDDSFRHDESNQQSSRSNRLDESHVSMLSSVNEHARRPLDDSGSSQITPRHPESNHQDAYASTPPTHDRTADDEEVSPPNANADIDLPALSGSTQPALAGMSSPAAQKKLVAPSSPTTPPQGPKKAQSRRDSKVLGSVARLGKKGVTSLMQTIKLGSSRKMGSNQNSSGGLPGHGPPPPPIQQMDLDTRVQVDRAIGKGVLGQLNGVVKLGREATIFHAEKGPESHGFDVAVKVYKRAQGGVSEMDDSQYDLSQFQNISSKEQLELWTIKEFRNLKRARRAGVPSPLPLLAKNNILFMQFMGSGGRPAPQLGELDLRRGHKRWKTLYKQIVEAMRRLFTSALLVHGNLNETNVLVVPRHFIDATVSSDSKAYDADTAVLIDFGQTVDSKHPDAMDLLRRDVQNLRQFFVKQGVRTPSVDDALRFITSGNVSPAEFNKLDEPSSKP